MDVIGVYIQVLVALPLEALLTKCVVVVIGHKTFIVDMPNMIEMEWVILSNNCLRKLQLYMYILEELIVGVSLNILSILPLLLVIC